MAAQGKKFNTELRREAVAVSGSSFSIPVWTRFFRRKYVRGMKSRLCFYYSIIVGATSKENLVKHRGKFCD